VRVPQIPMFLGAAKRVMNSNEVFDFGFRLARTLSP
jgi:hypothetical protein